MSYQTFNNNIGPRKHDIYEWQRYSLPLNPTEDGYFSMFNDATFKYMSQEITDRLAGVHPQGKNIIVKDEIIMSVLDSFYQGYKKDPQALVMMTISFIVQYIKDEYQIEEQNNQLNIWVTNFPQESGLRQFAPIKLREKRPTNYEFHPRY